MDGAKSMVFERASRFTQLWSSEFGSLLKIGIDWIAGINQSLSTNF